MKKRAKTIVGLGLVLALCVSFGLNAYLYRTANEYYLSLNATRLDPLGLNAYPLAQNDPQASGKSLVVFFGDSRATNWPAPARNITFRFANRGIGAQTTAQVANRYVLHVRPLKPAVVVVQVGINDLKTIPLFPDQRALIVERSKQNINHIVDLAREDGAQVILTTIIRPGQIPVERRLFWSDDVGVAVDEVNAYISSLAGDRVLVLDTNRKIVNVGGTVDPKYSLDALHLNSLGYAMLNEDLDVLLNQLCRDHSFC